jgi:hypothetical protein
MRNDTSWSRAAIWPLVWTALAAAGVALLVPDYVNHDAAWYLYMVRVLIDGGTLYRDAIDTNPPLIVALTAPPALLAHATGLSALVAFKVYVLALCAASLAVCGRLSRRAWFDGSETTRGLVMAALVFATLPFVQHDFGQREHFAVILTLPYLIAALAWSGGKPIGGPAAWVVGAAAGLGFAIKPHLVLGWIGVEAAVAVCSYLDARARGGGATARSFAAGWMRPEVGGVAATMVVYAAATVIFVPQYLPVARLAYEVYRGWNSPDAVLIRLADLQVWVGGLALLLAFRMPRRLRNTAIVTFGTATGFLLAAVLQFKGWSYHLYPARVWLLVFFVTVLAGLIEQAPQLAGIIRGGLRGTAAVLVVGLLVTSGRYLVEASRPVAADDVTPLLRIVKAHAPGEPIVVLSMGRIIAPAFPVVNYSGATWSLRQGSLWFLRGLYTKELDLPDGERRFRAPAAMGPAERELFDQVVSDLCTRPPALMIVEPPMSRPRPGQRSLDLVAYYSQDPRFGRLWSGYEPLEAVGPLTVYTHSTPTSCR